MMKIIENNKQKTVKNYKTVKELLEKEKINPQNYLIKKNNEIVLEDEKLTKNDTITLIKVVSGG